MTLTLDDISAIVLKRHDLLPVLERVILSADSREPFDLTGCTVALIVRAHGADDPIIETLCDVVDAEAGSIRYQWVSGDTAVAGTYLWELEIVDSDARRETVPTDKTFTLRVVPDLNGEDGESPSPTPDPASPIPYPIVYATTALLEAQPGVAVARWAHSAELGEALFRWVPGSEATRDGTSVLEATGGVAGRWIRATFQGPRPDAVIVYPSGDETGVTDRAAIVAAFASFSVVLLLSHATYYLSALIDVPALKTIEPTGAGKWRMRQGTLWSGTGETRSNCLLRMQPSGTGTTTTVATTSPEQSPSIVLTSATGIVAGDYFKVTGHLPGGTAAYGVSQGSEIETNELLLTESVSGNTVTHGLTQWQHHGAGQVVTELTGVVHSVRIRGGVFDVWDSTATLPKVASAIVSDYSHDVIVDGCEFRGFCGYAFDLAGCREWSGSNVDTGANTALRHSFSCVNMRMRWRSELRGLLYRVHPQSAKAKPKILDWSDQRNNDHACQLEHVVAAVWAWGQYESEYEIEVDDANLDAMLTNPDTTIESSTYVLASVWNSGANVITRAEFGMKNRWRIKWTRAITGTLNKPAAAADDLYNYAVPVYAHDCSGDYVEIDGSNIGAYGGGAPYGPTDQLAQMGMRIQDFTGEVHARIRGFVHGCFASGVYSNVTGSIVVDGQPGAGLGSGSYALGSNGWFPPNWDTAEVYNYALLMHSGYPNGIAYTDAEYDRPFAGRMTFSGFIFASPVTVRDVYWATLPNGQTGSVGRAYAVQTGVAGTKLLVTDPTGLPGFVALSTATGSTNAHIIGYRLYPGANGPVLAGAAIEPGQHLSLDSTGRVVPYVSGASAGYAARRCTAAGQAMRVGG